jgi:WD40-like Beta Propeller Repeat
MERSSTVFGVAGRHTQIVARRCVHACAPLGLALAVILAVATVAGCNDYGNTFQNPTGAPINFIAPSDAVAGGADFMLTVTSNSGRFVTKTVVQWNGKTIPSTYVSPTTMTGTVAAALIAKPGTAFVNTLSPHSGTGTNGLSNTITFVINPAANPLPAITSISPNSAAAGSASFTLTVNGSSFLPTSDPSGGSQVRWNLGPTQTTLPIVSLSSAQITATVDTSLLVNATTQPVNAVVTVFNPPSPNSGGGSGGGGGTSANGLPFTINPAGSSMAKPRAVAEETPALSTEGRYVAYIAAQDGHTQVFVHDTCEGAPAGCQSRTAMASVAADGTPGNDDSKSPSMSSDGRYIAFSSAATNLASGAPTGRQIYLRDTCLGSSAAASCAPSTQLVSSDSEGALVGTESILPSVSASGRFIAFLAVTPSHAAGKSSPHSLQAQTRSSMDTTNSGYRQVFVRDTCLGASSCTPKTTRISLQPGDTTINDAKPAGPALSGSSNRVALSGANAATVFTHAVAVDDRVFLALTDKQQ